ncbi:MAG: O-antigen ligase family protein [Gemmatimonadaceae bacterium]|nr:O-antigen ligase family protein [Gemmatimonadaceae bacterium]
MRDFSLDRRHIVALLLIQAVVLASWLLLPVEFLLWAVGIPAVLLVICLLPLYPWIVIPAIVVATALDSAGRVVQTTALDVPVTGFHLAFVLLCASLGAHLFLTKRRSFPDLEIQAPLLMFLGCMAISLTYSPNQPEATIGFFRILFLAFFLYLMQVLVTSKLILNVTLVSVGVVLTGASVLAILQIISLEFYLPASVVSSVGANVPRASGTYHNPNIFGTFLAVGITLLAGIVMVPGMKWWKRTLLLVAIGLAAAALIITFSRTNWISLAVGIVVLLYLAGKLRYLVYVTIAFIAINLVVMNFVPFAAYIYERFLSIFSFFLEFGADSRASGSARVFFVVAGFMMFLDNPLLGVGWRAFPVVFKDYKPVDFPHWLPTHESHTLFATILAELGLLGLTAAAWIAWRILAFGLRSIQSMQDPYLRGVMIAFVAVFITFQVSLTFTGEFANNFLWMFTGVMFALPALEKTGEKS